MAAPTAFHLKVGAPVVTRPSGESNVASAGPSVTVKGTPSLHGPNPTGFQVCSHHVYAPAPKVAGDATEHVPMPEAQFASAAVYHLVIFPPGPVMYR